MKYSELRFEGETKRISKKRKMQKKSFLSELSEERRQEKESGVTQESKSSHSASNKYNFLSFVTLDAPLELFSHLPAREGGRGRGTAPACFGNQLPRHLASLN